MTDMSNECGNSTTELDFEKHWSSVTIPKEVLRGIELRERKPKINEIELNFLDISLPSCSRSGATSPRKHRTRKVTRLKRICKDRHCPLRVVELAEPSKRHCLNTWKNNYQSLPDYMVERLRRHVMDEKPVVRIAEAVNYFKKKKLKKSSISHVKPRSKKIRDLNMILCSLFAYKIAQKLITPVNILLNDELANINRVVIDEINSIVRYKKTKSSDTYKNNKILKEMASKVTIWITNILEETSYKQLLEQLEEMEEEEGPVLDILDELLERVKTSRSSDSVLSDDSDTPFSTKLTEDVNESDTSEKTTDSKESNYVMQIDLHKIPSENVYYDEIHVTNEDFEIKKQLKRLLEERVNHIFDNNDYIKSDNNIMNTDEKSTLFGALKNDNSASNLNQITDNKNNLASNIDQEYMGTQYALEDKINYSNNNNGTDKTDDNDLIDTGGVSNLNNGLRIENRANLNQVTENKNIDQEYMDTENAIKSNQDKTHDFTVNNSGSGINLQASAEGIYEKNDLKLHNDAVIIDEQNKLSVQDLDEETKKVKFSDIDMGNGENWAQINKCSFELTCDDKEPVVLKSSKDYILSHFNVAPPNPNLLSYIDEVWPEYILPPLLKATESVNKSVTSLGRILEADDENIVQSPNQKNSIQNIENVCNKQLNTEIIHLTDEGVKKPENKDLQKSDNKINSRKEPVKYLQEHGQSPLKKLSNDEDVKIKVHKAEGLQILETNISKKEVDKHFVNDVQIPGKFPSSDMVHIWRKQTSQDCGDVNGIQSNISVQLELEHRPFINKSTILKENTKAPVNNMYVKMNKKIQTSVKADTNNDEFCIESEKYIRKWCRGLQNVAENLELWAAWIHNVCLNVTYLTHEGMSYETGTFKSRHIKKWVQMKNDIHVDVKLWSQLQTRLRRGLREYKSSYHKTQKATSIQANKIGCKCKNNFQKNSLCTQILFDNYYRSIRRV